MLKEAIELIEEANFEKTLLMAGYLFDEHFLKCHIIATLRLANEKDLQDFIDMFDDKRLDNIKYNKSMVKNKLER